MTILPDTHPSLRTVCSPVTSITPELKTLAMSMLGCLRSRGVGLAANQVGETCRLIVIANEQDMHIMFNPEIIEVRGNLINKIEGCLSVRGVCPVVPRYLVVLVSWVNEFGQPQRKLFTGSTSRVLQHEIAHLDGVIMTDPNPHCKAITGFMSKS